MSDVLIELEDGAIIELESDSESESGCETCDYGSSYINDFSVITTKGRLDLSLDAMYEYSVSEGFLMQLFLNNIEFIKTLTIEQFKEWIIGELDKEDGELEVAWTKK
ncbi:hypothetical protein ACI2JA_03410 [Alkalihalobacillus sp. NPDC078783]